MKKDYTKQLVLFVAAALFAAAVVVAWQRQGMETVAAQGSAGFLFARSWGTRGSGPGQFLAPVAVAVDLDGNVHVADRDNGRIQKFDPSGNLLLTYPTISGRVIKPNGIDLGPWGYI